MASTRKWMRELVRAAREQGWVVTVTARTHWKLVPPEEGAPLVYMSGTPSDWRAMRNLVAQMRRTGCFEWRGR